jgi:aspartate oxidase
LYSARLSSDSIASCVPCCKPAADEEEEKDKDDEEEEEEDEEEDEEEEDDEDEEEEEEEESLPLIFWEPLTAVRIPPELLLAAWGPPELPPPKVP